MPVVLSCKYILSLPEAICTRPSSHVSVESGLVGSHRSCIVVQFQRWLSASRHTVRLTELLYSGWFYLQGPI